MELVDSFIRYIPWFGWSPGWVFTVAILHISHFYTKIHAYLFLNQTTELGSSFVKKPLVSSAWCGLLASGFFITNFIIFIGLYALRYWCTSIASNTIHHR